LGLFNVEGAYVWIRRDDRLIGIAAEGYANSEFLGSDVSISENQDFAAVVANEGRGVFSNYFHDDRRYLRTYRWQQALQAALAVPLTQDEEVIGVLQLVETTEPDRFSIQDVEQIAFFGAQAAIAVKNAQLVTDMRQLNEELDLRVAERTKALGEERDRVQYLLRITNELAASLDQDRVLIRALELVNEVVQATHGSIMLVDSVTGELIYPSAFDTHKLPPLPRVDLGLRPEEGLAGWIIRNREAIIIDDSREDDRWEAKSRNPELRSIIAVPLIANDEVIGVLTLFHHKPNAFTQEQLKLVSAAAMQVASAISNAQLYLLIRDQAERLGNMLRVEHVETAKNQAILESIADGVLVADANGMVVLSNYSASQILEIPRNKLSGKSVNELLGLYSSVGENWIQKVDKWSRSTREEAETQFLADRLSIEDKYVSVRLSPVFARGQFFGTVSIFRDVTQAVEVDRMKSEFVSTVSHELRTPMTSVKGYAELMLMGATGSVTDQQKKYLGVIKSNADRMSELVNDLLDISRIESGKTTLDLQAVNLKQIIRDHVDGHLKTQIKRMGKEIIVLCQLPNELPMANADSDRVLQILTNLTDNAVNYTAQKGEITIGVQLRGDMIQTHVSDTGLGISKENQPKIFDRFYRVEDTDIQQVSGTGLGLAIVKSLVEMHGGTIEVASELGVGSSFFFTLPIFFEN
jgi:PAS domain S-box-containing protein